MKKKILVVDDADYSLKLMRTVLEDLDYAVTTTQDGSQVIALCEKHKPDLILLDVIMPGISGFDLCRKIKKQRGTDTKIIIYTGQAEAVDNREAREAGADGFAVKTEELSEVIKTIRNILS